MCNIAGYVGAKRAAPILIEMMRREEGFDAGYYTGIATIHEGKIYYRKLAGDLDDLLGETDALDLPGNIGILHSRTPSGGPDAWSHPFVSAGKFENEPKIAYVANGYSGIFASRDPEYNALADKLVDDGYELSSAIDFPDATYNKISNGKSVHMSDIMCALIAKEEDGGAAPSEAMENAFCEMPGEIVGLMLSLARPDAIVWAKVNRPMFLAFAEHGAYLATTPIAHLDDASDPINLPEMSSGYVTASGFSAEKFKNPPAKLNLANANTIGELYTLVSERLAEECEYKDLSFFHLFKKEGTLHAYQSALYYVLSTLYKEGKLEYRRVRIEGATEGRHATKFLLKLK